MLWRPKLNKKPTMVIDRNIWAKYILLRRVCENIINTKTHQIILDKTRLDFLKSALDDLEKMEK